MSHKDFAVGLAQNLDRASRILRQCKVALILVSAICILAGCRTGSQQVSSLDEIMAFKQLGSGLPDVDIDKIVKARLPKGDHRIVPDEVIGITMPAILSVVTAEETPQYREEKPLLCRVNAEGTIALPVIGEIPVAGLTLPEIESLIVKSYYPRYTKHYPAVYTEIVKKKVYRVSITGAVMQPGLYELPYDEMSLVALLMQAGGIAEDGAASIRIIRSKESVRVNDAATYIPSIYGAQNSQQPVLSMTSFAGIQEDVQLAFQPQAGSKTFGTAIFRRDGQEIFRHTLDISDRSSRKSMLRALIQTAPSADGTVINQQLLSLATVLKKNQLSKPALQRAGNQEHRAKIRFASADLTDTDFLRTASENNHLNSVHNDNEDMIVLPVKNLNIPFADVELREGDAVIVEKLQIPMFTVLGLVSKPGNYEYPPHEDYNLIEAIGFAGGRDPDLSPRYAVIYRMDEHGDIHHIEVDIRKTAHKKETPSGMAIQIKPGDIVAIEHTSRTRTLKVLHDAFRINLGMYVNPLALDD